MTWAFMLHGLLHGLPPFLVPQILEHRFALFVKRHSTFLLLTIAWRSGILLAMETTMTHPTDDRQPTMMPQEFADLQRQAGYPFLSEEQAQRYRLRQVRAQAIDADLNCPRIDDRRVDRD